MKRTIELDAARLGTRQEIYAYLNSLFQFENGDVKNLDALFDSLSEVTDDVEIILPRAAIQAVCANAYSYKILMVLGKAAEENPHLRILFRQ